MSNSSSEDSIDGAAADRILEDGIEQICLQDDSLQPGTSTEHIQNELANLQMQVPKIIKVPKYTCQDRYELFCKDVQIADVKPSQVLNQVHLYIEENLMNRKWYALWHSNYDYSYQNSVDILVEVDDVCADQAHVTLVEPLVCNTPGIPQHVVEAQLEELDNTLDVVDLYPVSWMSNKESMEDEEEIAAVIDNARFFIENIRRDWDDEDESDQSFDSYLRARLTLHYDIISNNIPAPLVARFNRTMAKYIVRRKELLDYQARIQSEGEPTNAEAVECWRKYYEVLMLSGLLQMWETLQLRAEGPCFPRVLRRMKGARADGAIVTHIISENLKPSMLRDFSDDIIIRQHKDPATALQQCHEGDTILLYPGIYQGDGFHELTENITIKGIGAKKDVIIEAVPYDDLFVNVSGANVLIENVTLVQVDNTEGLLRVESGHATVDNCLLRCDGTGVTVREGAKLTMRNCIITGCKGAGVELMPGSDAVLEDNKIESHSNDIFDNDSGEGKLSSKGGIHLHVVDPPKVRLINNNIRSMDGCGITIGRKNYSKLNYFGMTRKVQDDSSVGDAPTANAASKVLVEDMLSKLDIEMKDNVIEDISTVS